DVSVDQIESALNGTFDRSIIEREIIEAKYDGYIARQQAEIRRQAQIDNQLIPDWIEYETISGLRAEAIESLRTFRPTTMGQASRLAGITPADLTLLAVVIRRGRLAPQQV